MRNLILAVLSSSVVFGLSYATPMKFSTSIYSAGLNYDKSRIKKDGYVAGVYGYMGIGEHSLELGLDYTHINYKGNLSDLDQTDLTFLYTNYSFPNIKAKMGFHYIDSDDKYSDGAYTIILGLDRYELYRWNVGFDLFYTKYDDYIALNGKKGLDVYQGTLKAGFYFGDYYTYGSFYAELLGTYINHSEDAGFGKSFSSIEGRLSYYKGSFSATASAWSGERSFFIDKGGFVAYNLREKYKYGTSFEVGFSIVKNLGVSGSVNYQKFEEYGNPDDVGITTYVLKLGYVF